MMLRDSGLLFGGHTVDLFDVYALRRTGAFHMHAIKYKLAIIDASPL